MIMKTKLALAIVASALSMATLLHAQSATDVPAPALPDGTSVKMRLDAAVTTFGSKVGGDFTGKVDEAVVMDGKQIIPLGAIIEGKITNLAEPRRISGSPSIGLRADYVVLPDGTRYVISAVVVDTNTPKTLTVDDEGFIHGKVRAQGDLTEVGVGAVGGAAVGAIVGGPVGAAAGLAVGGGSTLTHRLMKHHFAAVPAGTILWLELRRPMSMIPAPASVTVGQ